MSESVQLDFSGVTLAIRGLDEREAARLRGDWSHFVVRAADSPFLSLRVSYGAPETGAAPMPPFNPKQMRSLLDADYARFEMPEGCVDLRVDGTGEVRLAAVEGERLYWVLRNLLRSAVAWSLPSRGGALLHAAGLIIGGRSFLLIGPEGSGKSTWARLGEEAGQHVLTDDLAIIDGAGSRMVALGSPFRSDHLITHRSGRWPLAAILLPEHGPARLSAPVAPIRAKARIAANLPFVADGLQRDGRLAALLERLTAEVPCRVLRFDRDPGFVDLLGSMD